MIKKFVGGEEGQGLLEYILIIALVATIVVIALTFFGETVKNQYDNTINGVASPLSKSK